MTTISILLLEDSPLDAELTQAQIKKKLQSVILEREYKRVVSEMKRRAVILIVDSEL